MTDVFRIAILGSWFACAGFVSTITAPAVAGEIQSIPIDQLGERYQLVGRLHVPLGKMITVKGVVVGGPSKGIESCGNASFRIQVIDGVATQEDIQICLRPFFGEFGDKGSDGGRLPALEFEKTYEMRGYESGGYSGTPANSFEDWGPGPAFGSYPHAFGERLVIVKARKVDDVVFEPSMFEGRRALVQGKAVTRSGRGVLEGRGWRVVVQEEAWPKDVENKDIETWGLYERSPGGIGTHAFRMTEGTWRLVRLEDQVGRLVELRGQARSQHEYSVKAGYRRPWYFHHRGTDLYVEGLDRLPGWTDESGFKPIVIRGRLEKTVLPDIFHTERNKDYFIVRDASWEPLPALLALERPFDELWGEYYPK